MLKEETTKEWREKKNNGITKLNWQIKNFPWLALNNRRKSHSGQQRLRDQVRQRWTEPPWNPVINDPIGELKVLVVVWGYGFIYTENPSASTPIVKLWYNCWQNKANKQYGAGITRWGKDTIIWCCFEKHIRIGHQIHRFYQQKSDKTTCAGSYLGKRVCI